MVALLPRVDMLKGLAGQDLPLVDNRSMIECCLLLWCHHRTVLTSGSILDRRLGVRGTKPDIYTCHTLYADDAHH